MGTNKDVRRWANLLHSTCSYAGNGSNPRDVRLPDGTTLAVRAITNAVPRKNNTHRQGPSLYREDLEHDAALKMDGKELRFSAMSLLLPAKGLRTSHQFCRADLPDAPGFYELLVLFPNGVIKGFYFGCTKHIRTRLQGEYAGNGSHLKEVIHHLTNKGCGILCRFALLEDVAAPAVDTELLRQLEAYETQVLSEINYIRNKSKNGHFREGDLAKLIEGNCP
ncbi:hypothetical protein PTSG_07257 [Salpingoeca rosetta]|uniref:GIY-YIG domain-containing protein n=1 Tax=Salpingoeca rosetta (strain ATCC 50818 / BSB-021) TaxID=946362 RepID=F2UEI2_SALR5|nr:uncharacterized protein PTSG_07257 [Salpingoeca rosetta]EGD75032.1 hypothetical protein PTSG_07257 [Salpingoeca rosetta]|eukprot:XP_004992676.1 hypothetical protein PTSG_07257 [Salpingoeca rosetta]